MTCAGLRADFLLPAGGSKEAPRRSARHQAAQAAAIASTSVAKAADGSQAVCGTQGMRGRKQASRRGQQGTVAAPPSATALPDDDSPALEDVDMVPETEKQLAGLDVETLMADWQQQQQAQQVADRQTLKALIQQRNAVQC